MIRPHGTFTASLDPHRAAPGGSAHDSQIHHQQPGTRTLSEVRFQVVRALEAAVVGARDSVLEAPQTLSLPGVRQPLLALT
jgi:hypothetical protein